MAAKKKKKLSQAQLDALARGRAKVAERRARASAATGTNTKKRAAPKKKRTAPTMATKKKKTTSKKGKKRGGAKRGSKSFLTLSKREAIAAGVAAVGIGAIQYMAAQPKKAGQKDAPMKWYVDMPQITAVGRTGTLSLAAAGVSMLPIGSTGKAIAKGAAFGLGVVSLVAFARRGGKFYTADEAKLLVSGAPLDELRLDRPVTEANGDLSLSGVSQELVAAINQLVQERANRAA